MTIVSSLNLRYTTTTKWLRKPIRSLWRLQMPFVRAHTSIYQMADRQSVPSLSPLFIIYSLIALLAGWLPAELLTDCSIDQQSVFLGDELAAWSSALLNDSTTDCVPACLSNWLTDCLVFQLRLGECMAAAARIECSFIFYSGLCKT